MKKTYSQIALFLLILIGTNNSFAQQFYWIGGSGQWDDPSHWSTVSGGTAGTQIPDATTNVLFDLNSGLTNTSKIDFPDGEFHVKDFIVTGTPASFKFRFTASGNDVIVNVYGNLRFLSTHEILYGGDAGHTWIFHGKTVGSQELKTAGQDLHIAEFPNENVNYHLNGPLFCSKRFNYYGGNLNTYSHNISAYTFKASTELDKTISAGTSVINCYEYSTPFTNGTFAVSGDYTIKANFLWGSASQGFGHTTHHPKIILKDYEADVILTDNNFECVDCIIDTLIIENTFDTRMADNFVVEEHLEILTPGTSIYFNNTNMGGNEITINGTVSTPALSGCEDRVTFTNFKSDITIFKRQSGTLLLSNVILDKIETNGGASFTASNSFLIGNTDGWMETNAPTPKTYHWLGKSGVNTYWDNPNNWELSNGSVNGCIPTLIDHVVINNSASNNMRIREGTTPTCNNFTWTKTTPYQLIIEGGNTSTDALKFTITGNISIPAVATITGSDSYLMKLNSNKNRNFETNGIPMPNLEFHGGGSWKILNDLNTSRINFYSGTLRLNNNNIETDYWSSNGEEDKIYQFTSSHIKVNGHFNMEFYTTDNVTVFPGTSLIECEEFTCTDDALYDLKLNNTSSIDLSIHPFTVNSLVLSGTSPVTVRNTITADSVIFLENDAQLILEDGDTLIIHEAIVSEASISNPAIINTSVPGLQMNLIKPEGNLCVIGPVSFQDINAQVDGVMHAPEGIDAGNNVGINFSSSSVLTPLYWIGNSGDWNQRSNWSNFSGGCPVDKNPNSALKLIFDDNSFISDNELVNVPFLTNCKTLQFNNSNHPANFDIQTRMNPLQVFVNDGIVNFSGYRMFVQVRTVVNDEGTLNLDMIAGEKYDTPNLELLGSGKVNVLSNTLLRVRN
jgi:hypothetical protein